MALGKLLTFLALAAAITLFVRKETRLWSVLAVAAAGVEVAIAAGVLTLQIANLPLTLILAGILAVAGIILLFQSSARISVMAATTVALICIIQVALEVNFLSA